MFKQLASENPDKRSAVACSSQPDDLSKQIEYIPTSTKRDRAAAIARARVVIVPSLFETASMVGLEALASSRRVLTWSHLGLTEYADAPWIETVEAWDLNAFACKAREMLSSHQEIYKNDLCQNINDLYIQAIADIRSGQAAGCSYMPIGPRDLNWPQIPKTLRDAPMNTDYASSAERKFKKLMRNPLRFVRDSQVFRKFSPSKTPRIAP
jgi:hypothetical protein